MSIFYPMNLYIYQIILVCKIGHLTQKQKFIDYHAKLMAFALILDSPTKYHQTHFSFIEKF